MLPLATRTGIRSLSSPTTSSDDGHPSIDVARLRAGCEGTASDLRRALFDLGYFYASNVAELPPEYVASLYDYSARCHALPPDVKWRCRQRGGGTGAYSGPDVGQPELQYEAGVEASVRGWDYSRARFSLASPSPSPSSSYGDGDGATTTTTATTTAGVGDDRYPGAGEIDPPFASVMDECYARQDGLARALLRGFEVALRLPPRTLVGMFDGGGGDFGTIRLLHYPGGGDGAAGTAAGIGAHTDFECFTLMHQNAPGLQILPRARGGEGGGDGHSREWTDMPVRRSEFVVIIGDMLERLTNGALLATPHRVVPTPHPRDSIVRFNAFAPSTVVAPMRPFVTDGRPAAYSAVTMETHVGVTMRDLEDGRGSWDAARRRSTSAVRDYGGERVVLEVGREAAGE
jgi:isopenicillin N synthase-like dioxygenase